LKQNMQYALPQFTDVEDKLLGPLTLKQFLAMLATGGIVLFFWSILGFSAIFFLFALPVTLIGLIITFAKFNGRQFFSYVGPLINFVSGPKVMIYRREGIPVALSQKKEESKKTEAVQDVSQNRVRKLAYLLDQKAKEEDELIEKVK
jgi:hypothetical protein